MFIDSVRIHVKAGNGGDGIVAWHREKYITHGGPSGGNGGRGGSIIFVGEEGLTTLLDFRFIKKITAENGNNGMKKDCFGASGSDKYVKVPIGTTIIDVASGAVIGDITVHNQEIIVAKGGRGGKGNGAFASPRNPAPEICEKGEPGIERDLQLELKVLADVGLIGFPSVGKSTLIASCSAAKPKIAEYHFTTLSPNLGVVGIPDGRSFIMADLPGLIEGASHGAGLGFQFLRHIERTRVLVHIIDMSGTDGRNPVDDYQIIRNELANYDSELLKRPEIIVANKMDLPEAAIHLEEFKAAYNTDIIAISAYTKSGINELLYKIADTLDEVRKNYSLEATKEGVVEYKYVEPIPQFIIREDDNGIFHVEGTEIEQLFKRTDFSTDANARIFAKQLRLLGVDNELRKRGVKNGDTVCILNYEFEFYD